MIIQQILLEINLVFEIKPVIIPNNKGYEMIISDKDFKATCDATDLSLLGLMEKRGFHIACGLPKTTRKKDMHIFLFAYKEETIQ